MFQVPLLILLLSKFTARRVPASTKAFGFTTLKMETQAVVRTAFHHSTVLLSALLTVVLGGLATQTDCHASETNLVSDGDFRQGLSSGRVTRYSGEQFGAWVVSDGSIDLRAGYFTTPTASNNVDLSGATPGTIEQTVYLPQGKRLKLEFLVSGDWEGLPLTKAFAVQVGADRHEFEINKPASWSPENMQWKTISVPVSGTGQSVTLKFSATTPGVHGPIITDVSLSEQQRFDGAPGPLASIPVPKPAGLAEFVRNEEAAIVLGKALFWDMQVGSDGATACASCHFNAGADNRIRNTLHPGAPGGKFGAEYPGQAELKALAQSEFRAANRANTMQTSEEFPFHKVTNPTGNRVDNEVVKSKREVLGSQGVEEKHFLKINDNSPVDTGVGVAEPDFEIDGVPSRQVTIRNAPTVINSVFFDRTFWDGRANRYFNGVNPYGDRDPNAKVWVTAASDDIDAKLAALFQKHPWATRYEHLFRRSMQLIRLFLGRDFNTPRLTQTRVLIDNATLASQATEQAISGVEMSWLGHSFPDLGRKLLALRPLAQQAVRDDDSVLGPYSNSPGTGLKVGVSYQSLIQEAFAEKWWNSSQLTPEGHTLMEANFSLFWGLAINLYEATLVSDASPYDAWAAGDANALSADALAGLDIFLNEGKCFNCHGGSEFAGATVSRLRPLDSSEGTGPTDRQNSYGYARVFDSGFFNIGVRPTHEDLGVGASNPLFGDLSYARQRAETSGHVAVNGAFKTPTLRNVELTGQYMHNGGTKTLTEVLEFYTRGADFFDQNIDDLAPHVAGIPELQNNPTRIAQLVEFLKTLTDERVRLQRAPFDHPELVLFDGHNIQNGVALDRNVIVPGVGANGGVRIRPFGEVVGAPLEDNPADGVDPGNPGDIGDRPPIQFGYVPFTQEMPVAPVKQPLAVGTAPFEVGNVFHGVAPEYFNRVAAENGQPYYEAFPTAFYEMRIQESTHEFFPGVQTPVYGYDGMVPGPTFKARVGQPVVIRQINELPDLEQSVHLHGGHNPAHSDGYPNFYVLPGEARDYYYTNTVPFERGEPDFTESPSTMWYHDHAMDLTAETVVKGLAGFFITQDDLEVGLVENNTLPRDEFDIPVVIQDKTFNPDGTIFFDPLDHNGYLGDTFIVNGNVQPAFRVQRRKYRFRFLNGANARFFLLRLSNGQPFVGLGKDTWLYPEAIRRDTLLLGMANRADVVIDFTNAPDELFLENILRQNDGRGPQGDLEEPDVLDEPIPLLKFIVEGDAPATDATVNIGTTLRPHRPIRQDEIVATRVFEFERRQGAWQINQQFFDENLANATPTLGTAERWILRNQGGGWWHPIHIHLESHQIQTVDGLAPLPEDAFKSDTAVLGPGTEIEIFMKFRTFRGPFVFHCHNLEHEDMRMMFVLDPRVEPTPAPQPLQQKFP